MSRETVPPTATEQPPQDELVVLRQRIVELEHQLLAQQRALREQAEAALQADELRLERIAANLPGMIYRFVMRPDGHVSFPYVSAGCREIYGLAPHQIEADASLILSVVHPDDREAFERSIAISAETLDPWLWEGRIVGSAGELKWLQAASRPMRQPDGAIVWDGLLIDITERKRTEELLWRHSNILEATPDLIGSATMDGRILYLNQAGRRMLGLPLDADISDRSIAQLHPAWAAQIVLEQAIPAALQSGVWRGETALLMPDGREIPISQVIIAHKAADGSVAYLSTIARDISEQKQAEAERSRLQEEIIQAQEAVLRELSTPLFPVSDDVVVMPLIGAIDSRRAEQVLETLLRGIETSRARTAILDITGVDVVDTQVANALIRAAQAARLLGTQVLLTGISPEVAQTLVGIGLDLQGLITRSTLQSGIAFAIGRNGAVR